MGGTQSKERVPPGDADSSNSSLVIHDAHFRTGSLFRYDRLCAEDDPVAVLCDFAKTYKVHGGFDDVGTRTYSSAGEVPGVKSKFLRLADKNPDLARRVALCHSTNTQRTDVVLKYISPKCEVTHFFEFLCLKAYNDSVSTDLFLTILRLAPEVARLEDGNGSISLYNAVGVGRAPLPVIKAIVTADDQVRKVGMKSVLEHANLDRSNTIFGTAASWAIAPWGLGKDFFDRIDIMRYILDEGGTKNMLCSRSGAQYYLLHNIVDILHELETFELSSSLYHEVTKELLHHAASKMYDTWTGVEAPSMLFAAVWAAQYMTGWREIKGGTSQDMRFDVHVNHDTVGSIVSALIEQDPEQLHRFDERSNTPLHVAAGLDCWFGNRHKELYGTSWGYLFRCLLDVDGELPLKCNRAGRLPIHIALSNYMTWDYGVKDLVRSKPATLRIADPLTRLLPFMSAGEEKPNRTRTGCSDDEEVVLGRLETSYRLLREDPAVILLVWNEK